MLKRFKTWIFIPVLLIAILIVINSCDINKTALGVLQGYKQATHKNVSFNDLTIGKKIEHDTWTQLLSLYVDQEGWVDYAGFKNDATRLDAYLKLISDNPPGDDQSRNSKMAYWLNAYNAFTIKLIIDHYPVASIKDLGGSITMVNSPWDQKFFTIGGTDFDLNTIEHEILRPIFGDPRIHFGANCASVSCPKLMNEAFSEEELDLQLDRQTKIFINNPEKNQISVLNAELSSIFSWFKSDFEASGGVISFINKYLDTPMDDQAKVSYKKYNWALNELQNIE